MYIIIGGEWGRRESRDYVGAYLAREKDRVSELR